MSNSLQPHETHHAKFALHNLLELVPTHIHRVGDAIQLSHPLFPSCPPALSFSQHQSLLHELVLHIMWPKDWRFSFSISPSNEYSGSNSFRIDWFDLLAVQGILKSLWLLAPRFENINSLSFSILYGPTLTSINNYWENHRFDYMDLCQQSDVSAF